MVKLEYSNPEKRKEIGEKIKKIQWKIWLGKLLRVI